MPPSRRRLEPALVWILAAACMQALPALPAHAADWPEFNGDGRHLGNNQQETIINSGNVATLHVVAGFPVTLPSVADGPPVFLSGVHTASGTIDMLFLTTKDGHIVALNAATGAGVWSKQPATGPNYTTSSPAIDPNRLYVYSYGLEGMVHKYQVSDGTEITTGGWPELATLKPQVEKCSPPLSVVVTNSGAQYLYVAHGGYPGDAGDYQGHITAINLATGAQNVFNAMCADQTVHFVEAPGTPDCSGGVQSAVWGRPSVVYSSELDRIFFSSSNGTYDASTGGHNYGDSVLAAHPDGTGANSQPLDSYTPTTFQTLQDDDLDLGSTSVALLPPVPGSNVNPLGVQGGKDAQLRLLKLADLSRAGGPAHVGGELQALGLPQGGVILTQPAVWVSPIDGTVWVFVANGNGITGLKMIVDNMGNPSMSAIWTNSSGGTSVIVANGLVFYMGGNGVTALDPTTGNQLFNDTSPGGIHWESLIVIGGRLYVGDESAHLWAYAPAAAPLGFFTLTPCRVVDTRGPAGPYGGPALAGNGARRAFQLAGQCGIPADAKAVAANITVVSPQSAGDLRVGPSGVANVTSSLNFAAGRLLASNTVIGLTGDPLGTTWVQSDGSGTANVLIDVSGYYK